MSDTELQLGAQARAAQTLTEAMGPVQTILADLRDQVASSDGFRGHAAAGLAEAVDAWFSAAEQLVPALNEYAQHLSDVDATAAETDTRQREAYAHLISTRLGGGGAE